MKITLTKPVTAHGEEVTELDLREPTARDVQDLGFPYIVIISDGGEAIQLQAKTIGKYASRLGGVPPSTIDLMSAADLSALSGAVMGFFGVQAGI